MILKNKEITIFTPTYNRLNCIKKLYHSLTKQTNKNFIWVVVDDGSKDDTELFFKQLNEKEFEILYYKQQNGGKYIAHNRGVELTNTEFFCCVDSDDVLRDDAIQTIISDLQNLKKGCIGLIYPRNAKTIELAKNIDIQDIKFYFNLNIETTIVIKNEILKNNFFPENPKEKFMSEEIVYNKIAKFGQFEYINNPIVYGDYLQDGLTKNIIKLWVKNYENTMLMFNSRYNYQKKYNFIVRIKNHIKCIMNCNMVNILSKKPLLKNTPNKLYSLILYIPSYFYKIWRCR